MKIRGFIDCTPDFKIGDPAPEGYIARQEWAELHIKAGLKQESCCHCGLWHFPHELSKKRQTSTAYTRRGVRIERSVPICLKCEKSKNNKVANQKE